MAITRNTIRIADELHITLSDTLDAHTRALVEAYAIGWDEVAGELAAAIDDLVLSASSGRVTRTQVMRSDRARRALETIGRQMRDVTEHAGVTVTGDVGTVIEAATRGQAALITSQLPAAAAALNRVPDRAVAAMTQRVTQRIVKTNRRLAREADAAMRRELLRGIAVGDNPRAAARRMLRGIEDRWDGGLARALTIARTETIDAHRAAALAVDKTNRDVVDQWVWSCSLSPRSCRACVAKHGTVYDVDVPGPQGHPQCRCARIPKTRSWRDLGFDIDEPADVMPDADAFVAKLSDRQLAGMLGEKGLAAFKRGDYPREKWAVRRENDEWRASYVPSRPPS